MFREDIESDMLEPDFNELKFKMEMEAMWIGGEAGAFFDFDSISKNRRIQYPMLPDHMASKLGNSQEGKDTTKDKRREKNSFCGYCSDVQQET